MNYELFYGLEREENKKLKEELNEAIRLIRKLEEENRELKLESNKTKDVKINIENIVINNYDNKTLDALESFKKYI